MTSDQNQADSSIESQVRSRFWHNPEVEEVLMTYDIECTTAHVRMLGDTGIVDQPTVSIVLNGLKQLKAELAEGKSYISPHEIDIHEGLERRLKELIGEAAFVVRIAKSRNDQIATDIRLWLRDCVFDVFQLLTQLRQDLVKLAERDLDVVMPGYTHMQPAQPILLAHWWLANECRFKADSDRLCDFYPRLNVLPLGASVLAGTKEPINRQLVAQYLRFDGVMGNSLNAVSDRDYLIEFGSFASLVGLHLSQMATDLLFWATQEFGFIKLQKRFLFRAHRLPFKKNPELLEVLRSRPSVFFGRLIEFISELKGVPTGFSQDLQECLPGLLDMVENLKFCLELASALVTGIDIDEKRMREVACADMLNSANAMDYLINKGVELERAQKTMEHLAHYCKTRHKYLSDLALSEWQQYSPVFEQDVYEYVTMEESVGAFCSFGGSSREQVELALTRAREQIEADLNRLPQKLSTAVMETSKA